VAPDKQPISKETYAIYPMSADRTQWEAGSRILAEHLSILRIRFSRNLPLILWRFCMIKEWTSRILSSKPTSSEDSMKYQIALLTICLGFAIGSFCIGQEKPTAKTQASSDVKMSDHDRIEKLQAEVAELQEKLAALTQKYDAHTHTQKNVGVAQLPSSIECNQTVVRWSSNGVNGEPIYNVCRRR